MHAVNDKKAGSRHIFGFCATKTMQFLTAALLYLASHLSLHKLFQTNTKIFADYAKLEEKPTQLHLTDGKSQYVTFQINYSICFSRPYYPLTWSEVSFTYWLVLNIIGHSHLTKVVRFQHHLKMTQQRYQWKSWPVPVYAKVLLLHMKQQSTFQHSRENLIRHLPGNY